MLASSLSFYTDTPRTFGDNVGTTPYGTCVEFTMTGY